MPRYDETLLSDLHKEVYGFRPTVYFLENWKNWSEEMREAEWDYLISALERNVEEDKIRDQAAMAQFESRIAELIAAGANDRATAIRWIVDSCNLSEVDLAYGASYICHELGLPYSAAQEFIDAGIVNSIY